MPIDRPIIITLQQLTQPAVCNQIYGYKFRPLMAESVGSIQ